MRRPRPALLGLIALAILAGIAAWDRCGRPLSGSAPAAGTAVPIANVHGSHASGLTAGRAADGAGGATRAAGSVASRARRDAVRALILRSLAAPRDAPSTAPATPTASATASTTEGESDPRDRPGNLADRAGGRDALVRQLNHDFMPLARECIERAHEQAPALAGMLAIDVDLIADVQHGALVDRVAAAAGNQVAHAGLLECIEQTALSMTFPPSAASGRESFLLTLRVVPADAGL